MGHDPSATDGPQGHLADIRRLVENLNDVLFTIDPEGRFTWISSAISRVSGYSPADLVGRSFLSLVHPDDREPLLANFLRILEGELLPSEYRCLDKDGSILWVRSSSRPLHEDGRLKGIGGVLTDITARRAAEEALKESEARFRQLVEMSPDMIAVHSGGRIVFVNEAGLRMVGATGQEQLLGRPMLDFVDPARRHATIERVEELLTGGPPSRRREQRLLRLDGTTLDVEVTAMALVFRGEPSVHVVARDISERVKAEEAVRRANESLEQRVRARTAQLEAANKELEAFSYTVSHDLRVPLRVIEGFSRMFLDEFADAVDPKARDYVERVHATSARMGELIRDILALSRVTRAAMHPCVVDLGALARSVLAELAQGQPGREVDTVVDEGLVAEGDPALLRLVLENLLGNAWKYTSHHRRARIEVGAEDSDEGRVFFVKDDGAGFDMRYAAKLFGAFQRLHPESEFEGTGIGLATVQRIVQRHGGRVWADSSPERGATFRFTLGRTLPVDAG